MALKSVPAVLLSEAWNDFYTIAVVGPGFEDRLGKEGGVRPAGTVSGRVLTITGSCLLNSAQMSTCSVAALVWRSANRVTSPASSVRLTPS